MRDQGRNPTAYARYVAATDLTLTILALVWLPVLVVPLVVKLSPPINEPL